MQSKFMRGLIGASLALCLVGGVYWLVDPHWRTPCLNAVSALILTVVAFLPYPKKHRGWLLLLSGVWWVLALLGAVATLHRQP
jgi:hypothetical protein